MIAIKMNTTMMGIGNRVCGVLLFAVAATTAAMAQPQPPLEQARAAVAKALPLLESSASTFVEQRTCFSCHHNALPILTFHMAQARGFDVDAGVMDQVEETTFRPLSGEDALERVVSADTLSDPTPNESLLLMSAHAAGVPSSLTLEVYATRLARWQRNGHWATSDFRPPHSYSLFLSAATAIGAIRAYMPEELAAEREAVVSRAREWLVETKPQSTEDAAFRLLGLVWASAHFAELQTATRDLLAMQLPSGGWPMTPRYEADAYSTGEALFALKEAGIVDTDPFWISGLEFLISSQAEDGSWHVATRMISPANISPPYFETGFPYGHDQVLSYAGSAWAVMGLLSAIEPVSNASPERSLSVTEQPEWVRTALFGTPEELGAAVQAGLDPNAATDGGTTVLMLAAPDAEKVELLLAAGADPTVRTESGADALVVAASYRGTYRSLELLMDAGVSADPPSDLRAANTALGLAAMTGDLANIDTLMLGGAWADQSARNSGMPLASAITFGDANAAQMLIDWGATASLTEATGVNLLHWAAITNRWDLIPVLAEAGVPLNDTDENGYTPLMYAASVDHGDGRTVQALLDAGADPEIPADDDLPAAAHARQMGHDHLAELIERQRAR